MGALQSSGMPIKELTNPVIPLEKEISFQICLSPDIHEQEFPRGRRNRFIHVCRSQSWRREGGGLGLGEGVSSSDLGLGSSIRKSLCCPGVLGLSTQRRASLGNSTPRAVVGGNRTGRSCCCLVGAKAQAPDMHDLWFTRRC